MTEEEFQNIDKKEDKLHYNIFVFFTIATIIKYIVFDEKIIGGDLRYTIFIFWIPFILGLIILGIYQRDKIIFVVKSGDSVIQKILYFIFLLIIGGTVSFFSMYTMSDLLFQIVNNRKIENKKSEIINFEIKSFDEDKNSRSQIFAGGDKVWFIYNSKKESLKLDHKKFESIELEPKKHVLNIKLKKGIWNHATVSNWSIQRVE